MKHIRVIHRLRTFLALVGFLLAVGAAGTLWWANHTGLPDSWRGGIELALEHHGVHADVSSLRYLPLQGIEAGEVTVFTDAARKRVLGKFRKLLINVDRTKLARGEFRIERLDLSGASVSLAVDTDDPKSKSLDITELQGRLEFPGSRRIKISGTTGMVGGVKLAINGDIKLFAGQAEPSPEALEEARAQRRRTLLAVIETIERFELTSRAPPRITANLSGDLEKPGSFQASFGIHANHLHSRDLEINRLEILGEMRSHKIVVHKIEADASVGQLHGKAEMDLHEERGHFEMRSSLDLSELLTKLRLPLPDSMPTFGTPPILDVKAQIERREGDWHHQLTGFADLTKPAFQKYHADHVQTWFSWDGERLLLEDFHLREGNHTLTARAFITPEEIRYRANGNLSVPYVQNAISIEPLSSILNDFSATEATEVQGSFEGHANPKDRFDWSFHGQFEGRHLSFREVPASFAKVELDLDHAQLDFINGKVVFDYSNYPLRAKHQGPRSGDVTVKRIRYDHLDGTVAIEDLAGKAFPAPIVQTFASEIADTLEIYEFHDSPTLRADGIISVHKDQPKQDLLIHFGSEDTANYDFLGKPLTLKAPKGNLRVLRDQVQLRDLELGTFGGRVRMQLDSATSGDMEIDGEIDWTDLKLSAISETYDFEASLEGKITGRMDFQLGAPSVAGLDGEGHIALEEAELFDVPMFGPLSPLIAAVLSNRKAGFQEADAAFASFEIKHGVISTEDFVTNTPSLTFTGDDWADLPKEEMDMTLRMNARGFLGIVTLPLRPFYGLFQFRGSGPISDPEWENVMFTSPPDSQRENLLQPPKAKQVEGQSPSVAPAEPEPRQRPRLSAPNR
ncbi:MAG: AsmA-like C-terminal region-containing protein [Verrucomicrobiales bacterium]